MTEKEQPIGKASVVRKVVGKWLAIAFTSFVIYSMAMFNIHEMKQFSLFLAFTLAVTFIRHPLFSENPDSKLFLGVDLILALISFSIPVYIWIDYWEFIFRVGIPTKLDIFFSIITIILVFEATRRAVGWPLLIIAFIFLLYTFFGQYLPPPFHIKDMTYRESPPRSL